METIINIRTAKKEEMHGAIYIGRSRVANLDECYGNPFSHQLFTRADIEVPTRAMAVQAYENWLRGTEWHDVLPLRRRWILSHIMDLQGKTLMCHCVPEPCHGEVLIKILHEQVDAMIKDEALERDYDIDEMRAEAHHNWANTAWKRGEL